MMLSVVLLVRTLAFNYDFSLSIKDNAPNYSEFKDFLKHQPIREKKPRPLSSITLPMAQIPAELRKDCNGLDFGYSQIESTPVQATFLVVHQHRMYSFYKTTKELYLILGVLKI